jgi:hypothetical protein
MDPSSQERFARGCTQAAFGYSAAATAAFSDLALRALDFWSTALDGVSSNDVPEVDAAPSATKAPDKPAQLAKTHPDAEPPFGFSLADWGCLPWFDPQRTARLMDVDASASPFSAFLAMANLIPLRGPSTSWPMARAMIDSGVPRAVAWPAAEANAAALDAADVATHGLRQILASYHTDSGYAVAARTTTPTMVVLAAVQALMMPLDMPQAFAV